MIPAAPLPKVASGDRRGAAYLAKRDPSLRTVIKQTRLAAVNVSENRFQFLVEAIIGQQLSEKAAATITRRFHALFRTGGFPSPRVVLRVSLRRIRVVGISNAKAAYIHNVARAVAGGKLKLKTLDRLADAEVAATLTVVKGIGPWTAEMFLIFALGRPDVFSAGDAGLQTAMRRVYGLRKPPAAAWVRRTTERWRPHRSLTCRYLWASLDNK
ncbi:MAG: DNA-3-methyladenine glycosylase 2 family protein [bacterium]|nr:DNA-3-methyladenine glycosylase 2 family protein [bacterium]